MQKQSTCIKCKNNLFKSCKRHCVFGQNSRSVIIYNDIFTTKRCKKVQSPAKQFKELFSLVCSFFALNEPSSALNYLKTAFILINQN